MFSPCPSKWEALGSILRIAKQTKTLSCDLPSFEMAKHYVSIRTVRSLSEVTVMLAQQCRPDPKPVELSLSPVSHAREGWTPANCPHPLQQQTLSLGRARSCPECCAACFIFVYVSLPWLGPYTCRHRCSVEATLFLTEDGKLICKPDDALVPCAQLSFPICGGAAKLR